MKLRRTSLFYACKEREGNNNIFMRCCEEFSSVKNASHNTTRSLVKTTKKSQKKESMYKYGLLLAIYVYILTKRKNAYISLAYIVESSGVWFGYFSWMKVRLTYFLSNSIHKIFVSLLHQQTNVNMNPVERSALH